MSRTVHLIHGFNERHKIQKPRMDILRPLIEEKNLNVKIHDYGHWDLVATRNNHNLARLIYPEVAEGDTLVGFSNGAALIAHLQKFGVKARRIVLIQPALAKTWTPNIYVESIAVFWNTGDTATVAGKWYRRATGLLPWRWQDRHNWGEMGHTGYTGHDERYIQYQTDAPVTQEHHEGSTKVSGHSDWCRPENAGWHKTIVSHV